MWKHVVANFFTVLTIALIALAISVAWVQNQYRSEGPLAQAICLGVPSGGSMLGVSRELVAKGAVSSGTIFRVGADYQKKSEQLKAGKYLIQPGTSMEEIVRIVTTSAPASCGFDVNFRIGISRIEVDVREMNPSSGRFETLVNFLPARQVAPPEYARALDDAGVRLRVTMAEGVTSWQVIEGLKAADFLTGEVAGIPTEGSLAPNSYEVRAGSTRAALIEKMQAAQTRILEDVWAARVDGLPISTPQEALIMASIIEKETSVAAERRTIASVFMNRLDKSMRLQFDPTIIYGITRGEGTLGRSIRQSDKEGRTEARLHGKIEYNTYEIDGLPPGPISNPGRASIEAAVNPDGSDYLFFVATEGGGHAFAASYDEHLANVANWRAIEAERAKDQ